MITSKYRWKQRLENENKDNITLDLNPVIKRLLISRGIDTDEKVKEFLCPNIDNLNDGYLFCDMEKAIQRVIKAKENNEKITIYGDYDVDGITSIAVMYLYMKKQGFNVDYYIPSRLKEGYGMNKEAIKKIATRETDLIITVDTGITAIEEAKLIKELGMDLIVTDHHEVQEELPDALCIINPKRHEETYPFKNLAGVGVSYKFISALNNRICGGNSKYVEEYIDLVTLGTIADVMELTYENRIIVKYGLERLKKTTNVGIKSLLNATKISDKESVSTRDVGYILAPKINAAGRLGDAELALKLLLEEDEEKANEIAISLLKINEERQQSEQNILKEAIEIIEKDESLIDSKIIVVKGEGWSHGVIGIVASRIVNMFYKPVVIFNEENGTLSGSARSIEGVNIFEIIESNKELLTKFGGHEGAAGLSLKVDNYEEFKNNIIELANKVISKELLVPTCFIDLTIDVDDISFDLLEDLKKLEPFGNGNEKPIFKITGNISNANIIGKQNNHLKLKIKGDEATIDGLMFNEASLYDDLILEETYEIVGELEENEFNNIKSIQCMIQDIRNSNAYMKEFNYYISLYKKVKHEISLEENINNDDNKKSIDNTKRAYNKHLIKDFLMNHNKDENSEKIIINVYDNHSYEELIDVLEKLKLEEEFVDKFREGNITIKTIYNNLLESDLSREDTNNIIIIVNPIESKNIVDQAKKITIIDYEYDNMPLGDIYISKEIVTRVYKHILYLAKINKDIIDIEEANYNIKDIDIYKILISMSILNELNIISFDMDEIIVKNLNGISDDNSISTKIMFKINEGVKNKIENSKIYKYVNKE